jgi:hypothetical protein
MSALPPIADIDSQSENVRFVPIPDMQLLKEPASQSHWKASVQHKASNPAVQVMVDISYVPDLAVLSLRT